MTRLPNQKKIPITNKDNINDMVFIPAGYFVMGSDETSVWSFDGAECAYNETTGVFYNPEGIFKKTKFGDEYKHKVYVKSFYIDKHEVTNTQFERFIKATGYITTAEKEARGINPQLRPNGCKPKGWTWKTVYTPDKANHPVVFVSWYDAFAYAKWAGKRLPTEEEWEKAARGVDGRIFPWGNKISSDYCNYNLSKNYGMLRTPTGKFIPGIIGGGKITVAVGSYPKGNSPYGVFDMCGNVWEWTNSWYRSYPKDPHTFDYSGEIKVFRGGCFSEPGIYSRSANRNAAVPDLYMINIGFRCAMDESELTQKKGRD